MSATTAAVKTLKQQLDERKALAFQHSLYDRAINGETIKAGDYYLYLDGYNVVSRKAKQADVKVVDALMLRRWQSLTSCVHCHRMKQQVRPATCCCNVAFDGSMTFADIMAEVKACARHFAYHDGRSWCVADLPKRTTLDAIGWIEAHRVDFQNLIKAAKECRHLTTVANTAGSPVCQECGQSW